MLAHVATARRSQAHRLAPALLFRNLSQRNVVYHLVLPFSVPLAVHEQVSLEEVTQRRIAHLLRVLEDHVLGVALVVLGDHVNLQGLALEVLALLDTDEVVSIVALNRKLLQSLLKLGLNAHVRRMELLSRLPLQVVFVLGSSAPIRLLAILLQASCDLLKCLGTTRK